MVLRHYWVKIQTFQLPDESEKVRMAQQSRLIHGLMIEFLIFFSFT